MNRREADGQELSRSRVLVTINIFMLTVTATTSKDRVWQQSEAPTNWVNKNNKNSRWRPRPRLNCFFFIDLTIAVACGDSDEVWVARFYEIATKRKQLKISRN